MAKQIKLKSLLKEGYAWERKPGKPLPTIQEVMDEFQSKQESAEGHLLPENMSYYKEQLSKMMSSLEDLHMEIGSDMQMAGDETGYDVYKQMEAQISRYMEAAKKSLEYCDKYLSRMTPRINQLYEGAKQSTKHFKNPVKEAIPSATSLDLRKIDNVEVDYDSSDYPDFADAYVISADYDGKEMTPEQLEILNNGNYADFIHNEVFNQLYEGAKQSTKHFKNPVKVSKLSLKETLELQKTARIITESQYKKLLKEAELFTEAKIGTFFSELFGGLFNTSKKAEQDAKSKEQAKAEQEKQDELQKLARQLENEMSDNELQKLDMLMKTDSKLKDMLNDYLTQYRKDDGEARDMVNQGMSSMSQAGDWGYSKSSVLLKNIDTYLKSNGISRKYISGFEYALAKILNRQNTVD